MARRISYSDVISQIQTNIGFRPSERNITDIKKALSRGETKESVISRFSKKYELNIFKDLDKMLISDDPTEVEFAINRYADPNFVKNANLAISGKVDKNKHPRFYARYKSAKSYALHTKWKETLIDKYREHVAPRITDAELIMKIERALHDLSIFDENKEITERFDELSYMYKYVQTTPQTFIDFLNEINVIDEFTTEAEINDYLSKFNTSIIE